MNAINANLTRWWCSSVAQCTDSSRRSSSSSSKKICTLQCKMIDRFICITTTFNIHIILYNACSDNFFARYLLGLTITTGAVVSLPFLYYSDTVVKKVGRIDPGWRYKMRAMMPPHLRNCKNSDPFDKGITKWGKVTVRCFSRLVF